MQHRVVGKLAVCSHPYVLLGLEWCAVLGQRIRPDVSGIDRAGPGVPVAELVGEGGVASGEIRKRLRFGNTNGWRDLVLGAGLALVE